MFRVIYNYAKIFFCRKDVSNVHCYMKITAKNVYTMELI
jgi:hypothetical protein